MFEIYYQGRLIGHSKLEKGDPPMGVALGEFLPLELFNDVKCKFEHLAEERTWRLQNLVLKTPQGKSIECHGGTVILAYESLVQPLALEFSGLGIDSTLYETIFPHHVKTYEGQWNN